MAVPFQMDQRLLLVAAMKVKKMMAQQSSKMWVASWIVALHWEEQDDGTAEQQEDEGEEDDGTAEFTDVQN